MQPLMLSRTLPCLASSHPAARPPRTQRKMPGCRGAAFQHLARLAQIINPWERLRNCVKDLTARGPREGTGASERRRSGEEPGGRAGSSRPGAAEAAGPHHGQWLRLPPSPALRQPLRARREGALPAPLPRPDRNAPIVNTIKRRWSAPSVPRTYRPLHPRRRAGYELSEHRTNGEPTGCPGSAAAPRTPCRRRGA